MKQTNKEKAKIRKLPEEGSSVSRHMKKEFNKICASNGACGFYNMCQRCYEKLTSFDL